LLHRYFGEVALNREFETLRRPNALAMKLLSVSDVGRIRRRNLAF